MAAALAVCAWLIASYDGGTETKTVKIGPSAGTAATAPAPAGGAKTQLLTADALAARTRTIGHPVYWVGDASGMRYDLTKDGAATIVRYVPALSNAEALRVGTIPYANAFAATKELAARPGASSQPLPNGGLVYYREDRPATYVVFPNVDYVIELDSSQPSEARKLALAGRVAPIG